jgi:NAD(P)-dependent dehydrogenase (short-subunit alcohol dehydrogenase family)
VLDGAARGLSGQARGMTRRLANAGVSVVGVAPGPLRHALASLARSVDQLPSISQQLDVLMAEVQAQRLAIQAVEAELAALDDQLAVLERSMAPIAAWGHQSARLRSSLAEVLDRLPADGRD